MPPSCVQLSHVCAPYDLLSHGHSSHVHPPLCIHPTFSRWGSGWRWGVISTHPCPPIPCRVCPSHVHSSVSLHPMSLRPTSIHPMSTLPFSIHPTFSRRAVGMKKGHHICLSRVLKARHREGDRASQHLVPGAPGGCWGGGSPVPSCPTPSRARVPLPPVPLCSGRAVGWGRCPCRIVSQPSLGRSLITRGA